MKLVDTHLHLIDRRRLRHDWLRHDWLRHDWLRHDWLRHDWLRHDWLRGYPQITGDCLYPEYAEEARRVGITAALLMEV